MLGAITPLMLASAFADRRPPRTYDLLHVKWEISINKNRPGQIVGKVTNRLQLMPGQRSVSFDCQRLSVQNVLVDGKPKSFSLQNNRLNIPNAGKSLRPINVTITYVGMPEAGVYYVPAERAYPAKTPVYYTQGEMEDTRNWLPTYDYPDDKATSEGTLILPKGWSGLSNGKLVKKVIGKANDTFSWKMDQAHSTYLISFVAGPYSEIFEQRSPLPVSYWVSTGLEAQGKVAFQGTARNVAVYEKLTGFKYPYAKYSQSAVPDFMFGGMENITATTQTISTLHPQHVHPLEDSTGLVAHELAHQWFGDTVTTPNWSHIWINEGWASFMPAFYTREIEGQDAFDLQRVDTFSGGLGAHAGGNRPMVWFGYKDPIEMFDGFAYPGGASRMFMLMRMVGEPAFWDATKKYLNAYKYKNVDTEQFFAFYSKTLGTNLDWFRKQWFYENAAPKLTVKRDGKKWTIEQSGTNFRIPTEVLLINGEQIGIEKVTLTGPTTEVSFPAELVQLDPAAWQMADIRYEANLTPAEWMKMYRFARNAGQRARLAPVAFPTLSEPQKVELAKLSISNSLRSRLIPLISDEAYLSSLLTSASPFERRAAVNRLGELKPSEATQGKIRELMQSDKNDLIRLDSLRALVRVTGDKSLVEDAWVTDSHQDEFRKFAMNHFADTDKDRARGISLSQLKTPRNEALRVQAIEILGRIKDEPGQTEAYDALVKVTKEKSFGARAAAINALAEYGDKKAIPVLEPLLSHPLSFIRNNVQGAVARLKGR